MRKKDSLIKLERLEVVVDQPSLCNEGQGVLSIVVQRWCQQKGLFKANRTLVDYEDDMIPNRTNSRIGNLRLRNGIN